MKKFISLALVAVRCFLCHCLWQAAAETKTKKKLAADKAKNEKVQITGVIATNLGDMSFNDSAKAGLDELEAAGYTVNTTECNTEEKQYEPQLRTAAENSEIVVGVGSELTMIDKVADDYPDVKFIWVDNPAPNPEKHPNLTSILYAQNEGSYLVGYIAGSLTETGVVGFIGGADIPVINDFRVGYEQGAKQAGKDLGKDVKVVKGYTGDWSDTNLGAEWGQTLHGQGADIIFCAAGGSGNGAIMKAKDLGYKCIGVDQDQRITLGDGKYQDVILCSMIKNVHKSIVDYINDFYEDDSKWLGGGVMNAGLDGGYVEVAYGDKDMDMLVPEDVLKALDEQIEKIAGGKIKVDTVMK